MTAITLLAFLVISPLVLASEQMRVTTDDASYCAALHRRVLKLPEPIPNRTLDLAEAGRLLCDSGHPRTGIAKLRRALRVAHEDAR